MVSRMRKRLALICLLVYQAIFLNIVLPGHTRGAVTMDGKGGACKACCASHHATENPASKNPTEKEKSNCAICHLAARIVAPPSIDLTLPKLGFVELTAVQKRITIPSVELHFVRLGRAPPVFS